MLNSSRPIMDSERKPLRHLPPAQRIQALALVSMMWTTIFCAVAGAWFWYGELVVGHILLALGTLITGLIFRSAEKEKTYRNYPAQDGAARCDDVWGV